MMFMLYENGFTWKGDPGKRWLLKLAYDVFRQFIYYAIQLVHAYSTLKSKDEKSFEQ